MRTDRPHTDAELEAAAEAIAKRAPYPLDVPHREAARVALRAVLPQHDARVRAEYEDALRHAGWRPPTPEQHARAADRRPNGWTSRHHRHFASDAIHRDDAPECDQLGTPRRVYVFDPDALDAHEEHIAARIRRETAEGIAQAINRTDDEPSGRSYSHGRVDAAAIARAHTTTEGDAGASR